MGTSPSCCGDRETHDGGRKLSASVIDRKIETAAKSHVLNLAGGRLKALPTGVAQLTDLRNLVLESNDFVELPEPITGLAALKSLDISQNQLATLPDLSALRSLQTLQCAKNKLITIGSLPPTLERIDLSGNRLQALPLPLLSLPLLLDLDVSANAITHLAPDLTALRSLRTLNLDHNGMQELPTDMRLPPTLDTLTVRHNRLSTLPSSLLRSSSVVALDVSNNRITREQLQRIDGFAEFAERRTQRKNKQIAGGLHPELDLCGL